MGHPGRHLAAGSQLAEVTEVGIAKIKDETVSLLADWQITTDPKFNLRSGVLDARIDGGKALAA